MSSNICREPIALDRRRRVTTIRLCGGLALSFVLLVVAGCAKKASPAAPPPPQVQVAKVLTGDVPLYLDEIGNTSANEIVNVQAQVSGQISARHFVDGAEVKKGDLLFSIDPRPFQAVLDQMQGQLAQARSQEQLDKANLQRAQGLFKTGAIARQDFETAEATFHNDEAKTQTAEAAVTSAQVNLDFCEIRSPIGGRAGQRLVDVGNIVSGGSGGSGGAVLVTIEASVIDVVAMDMTIISGDQERLIPIGGIAHAGARGISKVELQIDEGPWQPAMLRTPLSALTWVIWRYDWPFQHGKHTFTVRCYDGQGAPQIFAEAPPEPSGATGLYSKTQMF